MSAKVLLIGGAGYVGAHCGRTLLERGFEVVTYDDLSSGHRPAAPGELVIGDLRDRARLREVLQRGFDAVLHFAAKALVGESVTRPLKYFDHNLAGTVGLLREMESAGVKRLVFSSTCAVYGDPQWLPLDEQHPKAPVSPYGLSKWMVEQVLEEARRAHGFHIASLRYFNAAGASSDGSLGEAHDPETHLIPLAIQAALGQRPPLKIFGRDYETRDGTCLRDYIHVEDLGRAHQLALQRLLEGDPGDAWNLGTGVGSTVLEVLQAVERCSGLEVPCGDAERRPGDAPGLYAAASKAERDLGWRAEHDLESIVRSALAWHRSPRYP